MSCVPVPTRLVTAVVPLLLFLAACSGARVDELAREREPLAFGPPGRERPSDVDGRELVPATLPAAGDYESEAVPTDIDGYVALALRRSPPLRAAFAAWKVRVAAVAQAGGLPDPVLTLAHFVEEIQTRTGPQRNRIGLTQSFPWPGTLGAHEEAARREAAAAWQEVLVTRLDVEARVRTAYHDYAFLRQRIRIGEEQLQLLMQLEPIVAARVRSGGSSADLVRLQLEIGRLESDVRALNDMRRPRSSRLEQALSLQRDAPLPWPEAVSPQFTEVEIQALLRRIGRENPELRALAERIAAGQESVQAAEKDGYPKFSVGFDWFDTGEAMIPSTPGSGDDPYLVRVGISLPIWRDKYDGAERRARSELERRGAAFAAKRDELRTRLEEAAFGLQDAQRRIQLYATTLVPRAREAWQLVEAEYRVGKKSLLDLVESERVLLALETDHWRAVRDWWQSDAMLRALAGGEWR